MREQLYLLMTNLSCEERVIREYWKELTGDFVTTSGGRQGRLEQLARVARKLEERRNRTISGMIAAADDPVIRERLQGIFDNLTSSIFEELNGLKEAVWGTQARAMGHDMETDRLIADSQEILTQTSKSARRILADNRYIPEGDLVC